MVYGLWFMVHGSWLIEGLKIFERSTMNY